MNISSQDPSQEVAHVSNGDSGADTNPALFEHVEQPVDYNALIETALTVEFGTEPDGANFTVNLRQIELTPEQRGAIKNDIINVIIDRIGHPPTPPEMLGESDRRARATRATSRPG